MTSGQMESPLWKVNALNKKIKIKNTNVALKFKFDLATVVDI
jgi:hypothetical protein